MRIAMCCQSKTRREDARQRQMERNGPVGVVKAHGNVAGRRLNHQQNGGKLSGPFNG